MVVLGAVVDGPTAGGADDDQHGADGGGEVGRRVVVGELADELIAGRGGADRLEVRSQVLELVRRTGGVVVLEQLDELAQLLVGWFGGVRHGVLPQLSGRIRSAETCPRQGAGGQAPGTRCRRSPSRLTRTGARTLARRRTLAAARDPRCRCRDGSLRRVLLLKRPPGGGNEDERPANILERFLRGGGEWFAEICAGGYGGGCSWLYAVPTWRDGMESSVAGEAGSRIEPEARDPSWRPTPEMLEKARRYAASHGFPGSDRHDGTEDPPGPVLKTLRWVSENGWPAMEDGRFVDLRERPEASMEFPPESVPGEAEVRASDTPDHPDSTQAVREPASATSPVSGGEVLEDEDGAEDSSEEYEPHYEGLSPKELELAGETWERLNSGARQMGASEVIEELVEVVDVHPHLRTPMEWPGAEDGKYRDSVVAGRIGRILCRGCPHLEISPRSVSFVWRNQDPWTKRGRTVLVNPKPHGSYPRWLSGGVEASVQVNYQEFRDLNPLQKVFVIYRGLRQLDESGSRIPPHFRGFKDELELFGGRVLQELVVLRAAAEAAKDREEDFSEHQLSLLEGASE